MPKLSDEFDSKDAARLALPGGEPRFLATAASPRCRTPVTTPARHPAGPNGSRLPIRATFNPQNGLWCSSRPRIGGMRGVTA